MASLVPRPRPNTWEWPYSQTMPTHLGVHEDNSWLTVLNSRLDSAFNLLKTSVAVLTWKLPVAIL